MRKIHVVYTLTLYIKLNYRVILNRKLDYGATPSRYTSRQSASSPSPSNTAASLRFKSGDLKSVHLDRTAPSHALQPEERNENAASSGKKNTMKHRTKNEKNGHNSGRNNNTGQHKGSRSQRATNPSAQQIESASCQSNTDSFETVDAQLGDYSSLLRKKDLSACILPSRKMKVSDLIYILTFCSSY
jgi:hypothetical protein